MTTLRTIADVVALLAFVTATVLVATNRLTPDERAHGRTNLTKWLLAVTLGLYVLVTASDVATDFRITNAGHAFEDYVEALTPIAVLGVLFARRASQRYASLVQMRRALQQSHELMLDIVDGAPSGIMFIDKGGKIAFANDAAKRMLDLEEAGAWTTAREPAWTLAGIPGAEPGDLLPIVENQAYDSRALSLEWANGLRSAFRVSSRPLSDSSGSFGGAVLTFERVA